MVRLAFVALFHEKDLKKNKNTQINKTVSQVLNNIIWETYIKFLNFIKQRQQNSKWDRETNNMTRTGSNWLASLSGNGSEQSTNNWLVTFLPIYAAIWSQKEFIDVMNQYDELIDWNNKILRNKATLHLEWQKERCLQGFHTSRSSSII